MTISTLKTQTLLHLMEVIKKYTHAYPREDDILKEYVDTFNSLTLPKYSLGVDDNGRIHITMLLSNHKDYPAGSKIPGGIQFAADFIWDYSIENSVYTLIKDRYGEFGSYAAKLG